MNLPGIYLVTPALGLIKRPEFENRTGGVSNSSDVYIAPPSGNNSFLTSLAVIGMVGAAVMTRRIPAREIILNVAIGLLIEGGTQVYRKVRYSSEFDVASLAITAGVCLVAGNIFGRSSSFQKAWAAESFLSLRPLATLAGFGAADGAIAGGLGSGLHRMIEQYNTTGGWSGMDWGRIAKETASGMITGAAAGAVGMVAFKGLATAGREAFATASPKKTAPPPQAESARGRGAASRRSARAQSRPGEAAKKRKHRGGAVSGSSTPTPSQPKRPPVASRGRGDPARVAYEEAVTLLTQLRRCDPSTAERLQGELTTAGRSTERPAMAKIGVERVKRNIRSRLAEIARERTARSIESAVASARTAIAELGRLSSTEASDFTRELNRIARGTHTAQDLLALSGRVGQRTRQLRAEAASERTRYRW